MLLKHKGMGGDMYSKKEFIRKCAMEMYVHNNISTADCIKNAETMAARLEEKGYGWSEVTWPEPTYHPGPGNVLLCHQHSVDAPSKRYSDIGYVNRDHFPGLPGQ